MANRGAGTFVVTRGNRTFDVILVTGCNAEPCYIDQQVLALLAYRRRQPVSAKRSDMPGEDLGDCGGRKLCCHGYQVRKRTLPKPGIRLTAITTAKVINNMPSPITEIAPRSPLSLRS